MGWLVFAIGAIVAFLVVKLMDWTAISIDRLSWLFMGGLAIALCGCVMMGGTVDLTWLLMWSE